MNSLKVFQHSSGTLKTDFLFAGLNPNTVVQKKTPDKCTFYGCCFKNMWHSNVETQLLCAATIKFLATRLSDCMPLLCFPTVADPHQNKVIDQFIEKMWHFN